VDWAAINPDLETEDGVEDVIQHNDVESTEDGRPIMTENASISPVWPRNCIIVNRYPFRYKPFVPSDYDRLRKDLCISFASQYALQKLYWPRKMLPVMFELTSVNHPLNGIFNKEQLVFRRTYIRDSSLRIMNEQGIYARKIGVGLFANVRLYR
jgi:hypothetical protein